MRHCVGILLVAALCAAAGCGDGRPLVQNRVDSVARKGELLSAMRLSLLASEEAEKSAVMATTDSASAEFAEQSRQSADAVERSRRELDSLVDRDPTDRQLALAREFGTCWSNLREVDQVVLDYAVQNTNLKAYDLSFGRGRLAMDRFAQALESIVQRASRSDDCRAVAAAAQALAAGLKVHALHTPHIAESSDARMDSMEVRMHQLADTVRAELERLRPLLPAGDADLRQAEAANEEFAGVTAEVVRLSRQNTNVKSFELSLGNKRRVAAQCDDILASLQEEVAGTQFRATR